MALKPACVVLLTDVLLSEVVALGRRTADFPGVVVLVLFSP
jgi:hypothetical protein